MERVSGSSSAASVRQPAEPAVRPLESGVVRVYRAALDLVTRPLPELEALLAPDERERGRRLCFDRDRRRHAAGLVWLRRLLACHLGREPAALRFRHGVRGKPALAPPDDVSGLRFSASSSGDVALYAVALHVEVGVDVERIRSGVDVEQVASCFFARGEREALRRLAPELRVRAFFTCWTRKEAYVKARGLGLSLPLDGFDVAAGLGEGPVLEPWSIRGPQGAEWSVQDLEVETGYAAAVAVEGHPASIPRAPVAVGGVPPVLLHSDEVVTDDTGDSHG